MLTNKVMIVGLGNIGENALSLLARNSGTVNIIAVDNREAYSRDIVNSTIVAANLEGFCPSIVFKKVDLNNIEGTSELIKESAPDVILNVATLMSPWILSKLPAETHNKLKQAGFFGIFLPLQIVLIHKLMKAVKRAGISSYVVNACYCDAIHNMLGKVGLAPTVGMGNIDTLATEVQKVVSDRLQISMNKVRIFMVAHQGIFSYASEYGVVGSPRPFLKVMVHDEDVTDRFNVDELVIEAARISRVSGSGLAPEVNAKRAASSGVKNIAALLNNVGRFAHAPGPNGLPGGWPVWLDARGVEVVLPHGIDMNEALRIIEGQQKLDGIEKVEQDGTLVFTEKTVEIMKETFGYDHKKMRLSEDEEMAKELLSLFNAKVKQDDAKP